MEKTFKALLIMLFYGYIVERFMWWRYGKTLDRTLKYPSLINTKKLEIATLRLNACIQKVESACKVFDR